MALISVTGLCRRYNMGQVQVNALRGVDLDIEAGDFISIMGPSGSGKSTLLNLLGLLDRPTSGRYLLDGRDVSRLSSERLAHLRGELLGFVFQTFNLLPRMTARQNVELPLVYQGVWSAERRRRANVALARVGLEGVARHRPSQLSGGQAQRVAIARALVSQPLVLFADEPTGNLDSASSKQIMELFCDINRSLGVTVIQVTHDANMATYGRRLVRLRDGLIDGDTQEVPVADHEEHPRSKEGEVACGTA